MPKKRELTPTSRANLGKYLNNAKSEMLLVRSVFSGHFRMDQEVMKDISEILRALDRVQRDLKKQ